MSVVTIDIPADLGPVPAVTGSPASVTTFADELLRASATFDDLDTTATSAATLDGWEGDAATAYGRHVNHVADDASAMSLALRRAAVAADAYAATLTRLKERRTDLVSDRSGYQSAVADLARDADLPDATPEQIADLQARSNELSTRRARILGDIETLQRDEQSNDTEFRDALAAYSSIEKARTAAAGGDSADALMGRPGAPGGTATPEQVAQWWAGLDEAQRAAVTAAYPELIGSADGLPTAARNEANRLLLDNDVAALDLAEQRGELTPEQREQRDNIRAAQEALESADQVRDPITNELVGGYLHLYQPGAFDGDGAIAISVGDPDTADNVTTLVPGITTDGTSAPSYSEAAANIHESARLSDRYSSTAALFWIGYDAPSGGDIGNTLNEGAAQAGGEHLAQYVSGLIASRGDDQPHMTVIGHSYGSTTMAHAATDHGLAVDDLIFLGSPGAGGGVEHADELGGPEVWVGNASRDPVARLADNGWVGNWLLGGAGLGNDVAEDTFGANRFQAEHVDRSTSEDSWTPPPFYGSQIDDHSRYWEPDGESLFNIGQIVVGDDSEVVAADPTHDPFFGGVEDPEYDREPTSYAGRQPDDP